MGLSEVKDTVRTHLERHHIPPYPKSYTIDTSNILDALRIVYTDIFYYIYYGITSNIDQLIDIINILEKNGYRVFRNSVSYMSDCQAYIIVLTLTLDEKEAKSDKLSIDNFIILDK